jgi:hypothetical protein
MLRHPGEHDQGGGVDVENGFAGQLEQARVLTRVGVVVPVLSQVRLVPYLPDVDRTGRDLRVLGPERAGRPVPLDRRLDVGGEPRQLGRRGRGVLGVVDAPVLWSRRTRLDALAQERLTGDAGASVPEPKCLIGGQGAVDMEPHSKRRPEIRRGLRDRADRPDGQKPGCEHGLPKGGTWVYGIGPEPALPRWYFAYADHDFLGWPLKLKSPV